jgi:hypothetical protein
MSALVDQAVASDHNTNDDTDTEKKNNEEQGE